MPLLLVHDGQRRQPRSPVRPGHLVRGRVPRTAEQTRAVPPAHGWTFPWYSSHGSDFNYDFHVTLDASVAPVEYNYKDEAELVRLDPAWKGWCGEEHGVSAFLRQGEHIFHTYSGYARSTEILLGTYHWLDLTARGRQEDWEPEPRRGDDAFMSCCAATTNTNQTPFQERRSPTDRPGYISSSPVACNSR